MESSFFAVIPAHVLYSKTLKANSKLLYGIISSLTSSKGYCYASNSYLSEQFGITTSGISRLVTDLKNHGFISVKMLKEGKQIKQRRIYLILNQEAVTDDQEAVTDDQEAVTDDQEVVTNDQEGSDKRSKGVVTKAQRDKYNLINKKDIVPRSFLEEIKDLFNREMTDYMPAIYALNNQREKDLKKLIDFHEEHKKIEWWKQYFELIRSSDFLMGRIEYNENHSNWKCTFDFIINFNNFVKIIEGSY
jgi:hypothetical protein